MSRGGTVAHKGATAGGSDMQHFAGIAALKLLRPWAGRGGFSLESIRSVLHRLGDPQNSNTSIHVAGTNGKGSVSAAVAAILGASGAKVGLGTSPHLVEVNERIVIDGVPINNSQLDLFLREVLDAADGAELSYFEAITAATFLAFRELRVDYSVIEVGLGGRLDATNVIARPAVTAVTSIDLDHQDVLGSSLREIAREKGGIIKPGVPCVCGRLSSEAREEIELICQSVGSHHLLLGRDFHRITMEGGIELLSSARQESVRLNPSLPGRHQLDNMAVASQIALLLGASPQCCERGVSQVFWPARVEIVRDGPCELIIDGAHNPAGVRSLVEYLASRSAPKITCVFGALTTKDWREMASILAPYVSMFICTEVAGHSAVPAHEIASFVSSLGISPVREIVDRATLLSEINGLRGRENVLVTGSLYLVGQLRNDLVPELAKPLWVRNGRVELPVTNIKAGRG